MEEKVLQETEVKVESKEEPKDVVVTVRSIDDLPAAGKKTFRFERDGKKYAIPYTPLTYDQVEEVRASMLPPKPPTRKIAGLENLRPKELAQRTMMGLPTHEPDEDDPAYRTAMIKYNNDLKLEQVRRALGWDMPKDEFLVKVRQKFYAGEIQGLMDEIDSTAWSINSSLVDRFFENLSSPSTDTEESSAKSTNG